MKAFMYHDQSSYYPQGGQAFSPSVFYPEYPWGAQTLSKDKNYIYHMVRESFIGMGLDSENIGKKEWNPLGEYVKPGYKVLIKPNWVIHENFEEPSGKLDCLVTHASVIRAVLDYVWIAQKGQGYVVVGDSPIQLCDFDRLMERGQYNEVWSFFESMGWDFKVSDFRQVCFSVESSNLLKELWKKSDDDYIAVNLGENSYHTNKEKFNNYRITNYVGDEMRNHHNDLKHEYLIPKEVLDSDVIINIPKPKCHRKAGMTAALKNIIGISGNKEWLPHYTKGSAEANGDEYLKTSLIKDTMSNLIEKINKKSLNGHCTTAYILRKLVFALSVLNRLFKKDDFFEGSWHGNDTIWRTILDINKVLLYGTVEGTIDETLKRKCITIGDMVVMGEGEGPLHPTPKQVGSIMIADNSLLFDVITARIMGFDPYKIPYLNHAWDIKTYPLSDVHMEDMLLNSNISGWNQQNTHKIKVPEGWRFKPSKGWVGKIEAD